jgi:hypothetical protein
MAEISKSLYIYIVCQFLTSFLAKAQEITLRNPSFEDAVGVGHVPQGWVSCTGQNSPPETEPCNVFEVTKSAAAGKTYLGLVVRYDGSSEGVSQALRGKRLQKDSIYTIVLYLYCSSEKRAMTKRRTIYIEPVKESFSSPTRLRIWGGHDECDFKELLLETPLIENRDWKDFKFRFQPKADFEFISLEAYFESNFEFYNGNLMIDDIEIWKE